MAFDWPMAQDVKKGSGLSGSPLNFFIEQTVTIIARKKAFS